MSTQNTPDTVEQIRAVMARHHMSRAQMAAYLGVPLGTLGNWMQGTREPNTVVERLLYVLGTLEVMAPGIHAALIPKGK